MNKNLLPKIKQLLLFTDRRIKSLVGEASLIHLNKERIAKI